ncbi:phosphoribosylanthranilate isomerase [Neobittarella massiliensis]|uniref:N-(5'-phosphoribosyl)anthranilate isomerase n=1 Tax=Neobittarella massiliensis (ex Bilen et al. 2018) TaxID=2041842 RepID=A0A8J6IF41_9FIRM|nr:phosphoribosylanthranilate isomerase [Neobittarella massiliensis]MBC3516005.1 phosphoribosylanthranilate isomerase [Neobittarella massiliensis]
MITQIYSIISVEEALQCVEAGADYIGVLVEDAGRGCPCAVPLETAADIFRALAGKATRVMIPASDREENILHYARTAQPDIVHLSSSFKSSAAFQAKLEAALPGAKIMQAIGMSGPEAYDEALQRQKYADYLLLDSVSPNAQNGGIGAVGVPHDWSISKKIVDAVDIPVILAGGLGPDNVVNAIHTVHPFGVDSLTKTSVKNASGKLLYKDISKVRQFCHLAHSTHI